MVRKASFFRIERREEGGVRTGHRCRSSPAPVGNPSRGGRHRMETTEFMIFAKLNVPFLCDRGPVKPVKPITKRWRSHVSAGGNMLS